MRDSMVFYRSFWEAATDLSEEDQLKVFRAIIGYALDGIEPEGKGIASAIFKMAKPQIDANGQRYKNGIKGGRPKTEAEPDDNQAVTEQKPKDNQTITKEEPNKNQRITKAEPNVNVNVNVNDNENVNVNNPPIVPPGDGKKLSPLTKTQLARFKLFWDAYPRKENKGAAERAWKKINPDDALTQAIVNAVGQAQKLDNRFRDKQYIPHPSTWLNGRGWEDEYDTGRSPPQRNYDDEDDFITLMYGGRD